MVADDELAFQMQLNEAIAASMGAGSLDLTIQLSPTHEEILAFELEDIERIQVQVQDSAMAANEQQRVAKELAQVRHDLKVAREVEVMDDGLWEQSGDLFEEPFCSSSLKEHYRLYFKGFPVQDEDGSIVGIAIGGALFDPSGNQASEVRRFLDCQKGKVAAQYTALCHMLDAAHALGARRIIAYTDAHAVHRQLLGDWKPASKVVQEAYDAAKRLTALLLSFEINLALDGENWPAENAARQAWLTAKQDRDASAGEHKESCIICLENKTSNDMYEIQACAHKFCLSCVKQHADGKVTSGQMFPVPCPQVDCKHGFKEEESKLLLPPKSLKLFLQKLEESRIPEAYRVYCPYQDCSELMDRRVGSSKGQRIRSCDTCRKVFCTECRVPWHQGYSCLEYQALPPELRDREEAKLFTLARHEQWRQCKKCNRMIELSEGCYHMTCRCGYEFCYTCGAEWKNKMQTCSCKLWDEHNIIRGEVLREGEDDMDDLEDMEMEPPIRNRFYKTQLCRYFAGRGFCRLGWGCHFAHGEAELRAL